MSLQLVHNVMQTDVILGKLLVHFFNNISINIVALKRHVILGSNIAFVCFIHLIIWAYLLVELSVIEVLITDIIELLLITFMWILLQLVFEHYWGCRSTHSLVSFDCLRRRLWNNFSLSDWKGFLKHRQYWQFQVFMRLRFNGLYHQNEANNQHQHCNPLRCTCNKASIIWMLSKMMPTSSWGINFYSFTKSLQFL